MIITGSNLLTSLNTPDTGFDPRQFTYSQHTPVNNETITLLSSCQSSKWPVHWSLAWEKFSLRT